MYLLEKTVKYMLSVFLVMFFIKLSKSMIYIFDGKVYTWCLKNKEKRYCGIGIDLEVKYLFLDGYNIKKSIR